MRPTVFNHQQYTDLEADYMILKAENERLRKEIAALAIESVEREKNLARLEAEVLAACNSVPWIPVTERLPAPNVSVIICLTDKLYTPAEAKLNIDNKSFLQYRWSSTIPIEWVTHWMPLPEPPEEGGGNEGNI